MSTLVHVILSGSASSGLSSRGQFIPSFSGKSLFQLCIEYNISFADRQLVVGRNEYYVGARDYFKSTGNRTYLNIIEEDHLTNIYSVAFAAFSAAPEEILLITPSHYLISDEAAYKEAVEMIIRNAKEEQIGVLAFHPEQHINGSIPFMVCEEGRIKSFEITTDSKQGEAASKNKKHFIYSGILCCKAGIYLRELKTWAPEVYQEAKKAWEARVAQYVAIDTSTKVSQTTIEEVLLKASDKVKVVPELTAKLQVPVKNIDDQTTTDNLSSGIQSNKGSKMMGLAL